MKFRELGRLRVSAVGLGTMSWPGCRYGIGGHKATEEEYQSMREMVAAALDSGINLIDTAPGYGLGLAEEVVGRALAETGRRDETVIVTKVGPLFGEEKERRRTCDLSAKSIAVNCEESLRRLRTDRIDLYLAHHPDEATPVEETIGAFVKLREEGKVREFGVSNFRKELLEEALKYGPVVADQLAYSLIDRSLDREMRPFCRERGVGIMAYSPLGKGVLSGKYDETHLPPPEDYRHQRKHFAAENLPRHLGLAKRLRELAPEVPCEAAQLALAWVLAQPGMTVILPGARTPEQIRHNAVAGGLDVPAHILAELDALSQA